MSDHEINPTEVCQRAFALMQSKQYDDAEKLLANNLSKTAGDTAKGLYHSAFGVLCKLRSDYKEAWRHYQRAEKLIPNDPALKIIVARLLIDQFAEYDSAIKRAKRVLEIIPENVVFAHQAYTTLGLAYIKKSNKKQAVLPLVLEYKDANNNNFKDNVKLPLKIYSTAEAKKLGLIKGDGKTGFVVIIVVIVLGLIFYRRWRKAGKKKA